MQYWQAWLVVPMRQKVYDIVAFFVGNAGNACQYWQLALPAMQYWQAWQVMPMRKKPCRQCPKAWQAMQAWQAWQYWQALLAWLCLAMQKHKYIFYC